MMRKTTALIMFALFIASSVGGQVPNLPKTPNKEGGELAAPANVPPGVHELTAQDLEAFLDGLMPLQLAGDDIAGATIAVVKDGKLLFAKGYGYADYEKKKPVAADETLFRPGSVSKLFTWTAVMQLVEQGKLDLDGDVNAYLDFHIPDAYGQPITLKNILSHTPGFDEQVKDIFNASDASPDLGQYLKTHIPARVYPPGVIPSYSNYGAALAGYIVERVSGRPFNEYVAENIFKPLGMTHSTFEQPLPANLAPSMSNGYELASDGPKPFEMIGPFPAGSLSSTAADMARFMLAHLQNGQLGGARILRPETARLMHSQLFALDPATNAMCYGFYEESRNGQRIIGHGGDTVYFHSDLHLLLDKGVGFFVSHNSPGRGAPLPRTTLWEMFLDRYFPYTAPAPPTLGSAKEDARAVSGSYISSRRSETSFFKAASLLGEATVAPTEDGMIEVAQLTGANGKPKRWREVAPLTFLEENGQEKLIFKPDQSGRMQMILPYPFFIFQRVGFWENQKVLLPVLAVSLLVMLLTLVLWPVAFFVRRHYGQKLELTPTGRRLRLILRVVFALDVFFVVAMTVLVIYGSTHLEVFTDRWNMRFHLIQVIGVIGAVGTLAVLYNAAHSWVNKRNRIWGKLQATILALACLGLLWFAFVSHLLHFSSNY
ncbi:MAG TPA: serine hydrolase domain-containing protein [Blastocatellia bacterium]|nr:serine hydrolase domain-containing protein [Blastocatellia bacterium]